ncbi:MFS transporter [Murinocardiopsis flavida]|uniref:MFS transporter n=1 Tax=Murinocardiopsis flavida TaxID=645275 RepID=A0A2P8CUV4_9ACTN|nr:MFS transporter [Murinocardiopsis flavida]PSK88754.1 MFS transporter [Murinocardiopsis flavida]
MATGKSRRLPPFSGVLVLVMASTGLVVIDITIVALGLPSISADIAGGASAESVVVTYTVAMGALTQVVGSLSDRWGRRPLFLAGIAVFTLASVAATAAPSLGWLNAARAVQGAGAAVIMVNGIPLLSGRYSGEARNLAIGAWGSFATAAGLIAPTFGGLLIDAFGWRAVFAINVPLGIAAYILAARVLPRLPRAASDARPDWVGSLLLMAGLGTTTMLMLRPDAPWSGRDTALLAIAAVALAGFFLVQLRVPSPTLELWMFTRPAFTGAMLAVFLSRVLTIGGTVYLVLYFAEALRLSPTAAGLLMTPIFAAQMITGMVGSKLLSHWAPGLVIGLGYALKGAGLTALALLVTPDTQWWALLLPLLAWGAGGGIAGAPVMAVAVNVTAPERVGMVAGSVSTLASIGGGVGTAALGAVYTIYGGPDPNAVTDGTRAVLTASAALSVLAVITTLILINPRRVPRPARDREEAAA